MAFMSKDRRAKTPDLVVHQLAVQGGDLKKICVEYLAKMDAGTVTTVDTLWFLLNGLTTFKTEIDQNASTPGLMDAAKRQFGDQAYDFVKETDTLKASTAAAIDWIVTNYPKDRFGGVVAFTLSAQGVHTPIPLVAVMPNQADRDAMRAGVQAIVDAIA